MHKYRYVVYVGGRRYAGEIELSHGLNTPDEWEALKATIRSLYRAGPGETIKIESVTYLGAV